MELSRGFKGVWIPKELYCQNELSWSEKILLVEIHSFCNGTMGCFAGNEHFAKHLMLSKDRISKLISTLSKNGYLITKMTYRQGTKQIERREIFLTEKYYNMYLEGIVDNTYRGIGENDHRGIVENAEDNNTSFFNNTSFNNTSTYIEPTGSKPAKHKYGEYNNVLLTDEELEKLNNEFADLDERIERLSEYIASKGTKYKSHYATIKSWARKETEQKPKEKGRLDWLDDIR